MRTTLRGAPVVAAPGKLFLVGEYAVLDGGTAVVAAVDRHATGQFVPDMDPESPLVAESVRAAAQAIEERASALPYGSVLVDTTAFTQAGAKLGLGSSAATAAASVGAVMEMAGLSVSANRALLFEAADAAHRAAQGGTGSGADVAASVHGGVIQFRRPPGKPVEITQLSPPASLEMVAFWTGQPSSTETMVQAVQAYARRARDSYDSIIQGLCLAADRFVEAFLAEDDRAVISASRAYGEGLVELGAAAASPIVTPLFQRAAEIALILGGAAKPSGAGGGDVGVALFTERDAVEAFALQARGVGLSVLDITVDMQGVNRRLPGPIHVTS